VGRGRPANASRNLAGYARTSLVTRAGDLHGRRFPLHDTYDDHVHPQLTQACMDELIKAGTRFDLMIYSMQKHSSSAREATLHLYRTMRELWTRNL